MTDSIPTLRNQNIHTFFGELLGGIQAENVLDVATGLGGFAGVLKTHLKGYTHITGIDLSEELLQKAGETYPDESMTFKFMDAGQMDFPDGSFDLVACAFSLHHMDDIPTALSEIRRVLKPGGWFVLVEMYRNHLEDTQITESMIHHWAGDIDTALGTTHNHTFTRQEILELVQPESWRDVQVYDVADLTHEPKAEEVIGSMSKTIDRVLAKAQPLPDYAAHQKKAEELRQRLNEVGLHVSTRLVMLARK